MINENRGSRPSWALIAFLLSVLFISAGVSGAAGKAAADILPEKARLTVVIDPGHGGHDIGGKGPDGAMEKQVTFALAEALVAQLESVYDVVLTRTGDYKLGSWERSSIANHHGADLFISLHAGASIRRALNRWTIYHEAARRPDGTYMPPQTPPFEWHRLQQRHLNASVDLAGCLKKRLETALGDPGVDIAPAPTAVLQGVDSPAVLIETGYLTHPAAASEMLKNAYLLRTAGTIAEGIVDFFGKKQVSRFRP